MLNQRSFNLNKSCNLLLCFVILIRLTYWNEITNNNNCSIQWYEFYHDIEFSALIMQHDKNFPFVTHSNSYYHYKCIYLWISATKFSCYEYFLSIYYVVDAWTQMYSSLIPLKTDKGANIPIWVLHYWISQYLAYPIIYKSLIIVHHTYSLHSYKFTSGTQGKIGCNI